MKVTLTIPDEQVSRITNAFTSAYGYQEKIIHRDNEGKIEYIDNTQTKGDFVKNCIMDFIRETVKRYETDEAQRIAVQNITTVDVS